MEYHGIASFDATKDVNIHQLIKMVKTHEHEELMKKDSSKLNEEEKHKLRYFYLYYLDTEAWDKKNIDVSLKCIDVDVSTSEKICD